MIHCEILFMSPLSADSYLQLWIVVLCCFLTCILHFLFYYIPALCITHGKCPVFLFLVHAFKQKMASTLGETPPRKKRKRAPDDPFEKNVVVLRNGRDVTRRDDVVLMPNTTIDMSRIKRRENGQFQKITFKCSMTDEEIKTLLQEIFPFLRGQR